MRPHVHECGVPALRAALAATIWNRAIHARDTQDQGSQPPPLHNRIAIRVRPRPHQPPGAHLMPRLFSHNAECTAVASIAAVWPLTQTADAQAVLSRRETSSPIQGSSLHSSPRRVNHASKDSQECSTERATGPVVIPSKRSAARNLLSIHASDASHFSNADQ